MCTTILHRRMGFWARALQRCKLQELLLWLRHVPLHHPACAILPGGGLPLVPGRPASRHPTASDLPPCSPLKSMSIEPDRSDPDNSIDELSPAPRPPYGSAGARRGAPYAFCCWPLEALALCPGRLGAGGPPKSMEAELISDRSDMSIDDIVNWVCHSEFRLYSQNSIIIWASPGCVFCYTQHVATHKVIARHHIQWICKRAGTYDMFVRDLRVIVSGPQCIVAITRTTTNHRGRRGTRQPPQLSRVGSRLPRPHTQQPGRLQADGRHHAVCYKE